VLEEDFIAVVHLWVQIGQRFPLELADIVAGLKGY